ncbi:hypothetical protein SNE40_005619 [Patella caerulea]|uniref:Progestin and adipoQ receptor family member 3 n=1 Tax=Patella caerulea TaxID=87958 RepID=A0AAN8KAQ5_PATCE
MLTAENTQSVKVRPVVRPFYNDTSVFIEEEPVNFMKQVQHKNCISLYHYKEIPQFLSGNPYILHGYRVHLPFNLCIKSLFVWSNETINIWSHLIGFFIFLTLMLYDIVVTIPNFNGVVADYFIMSFGLLCFQYCMLCSTGYHLFGCHSERSCEWWLGVDMGGISIGVIGCYIPAVYYAFYCMTIWRDIYILIICLLTVSTLFLQRFQDFSSKRWFRMRILIFTALAACGVIPSAHWIYLNNGFSATIVQIFIPKVAVLYILGMIALAFYLSRFPERLRPGMFDMIGSSHQCWHFVVVIAFLWCYNSGREILQYRIINSCTL